MRYPIEVPHLGSLILTHSWDGSIKDLKEWPESDRPPVALPFFAFRIMVGIGVVMLIVAIAGMVLQLRGRLWDLGWFLRLCPWVAPLGFVAVIAGWITTEVGRQPWTVYGLMRTAESSIPFADSGRCNAVASTLYHRVPDHVSDGHRIHGGAGATRATTAGSRIGTG